MKLLYERTIQAFVSDEDWDKGDDDLLEKATEQAHFAITQALEAIVATHVMEPYTIFIKLKGEDE